MYSQQLLALFQAPDHAGRLIEETHRGVAGTLGCGPYLVLTFRVAEGRVLEARFQTYGCPAAIACAEAACAWSEGQPLSALAAVTAAEVNGWVGGVPAGKEHCPALAAQALGRAGAGG